MIIALTILAVARVTRLVTTDVLFNEQRGWVLQKLINPGRLRWARDKTAYLIVCDWCASVYTGAAGAVAYAVWGETLWFMAVVLALSASYATGFLASITERGD
jgi:hypothetical protein